MPNKLTLRARAVARRSKQLTLRDRALDSIKGDIFLDASDGTTFELKEGEDGKKLKQFDTLAYTGKVVEKFGQRIIIDVSGLSFKKVVPLIADHDSRLRIGHGGVDVTAQHHVRIKGLVSSTSETATNFVNDSANGFPFEASVGVTKHRTRYVPEKQKVHVNGVDHVGPLVVVEKGTLREVSVTTLGADDETSATTFNEGKKRKMASKSIDESQFAEYLDSDLGFTVEDFEGLSEKAQSSIEEKFEAWQADSKEQEKKSKEKPDEKTELEEETEKAKKNFGGDNFARWAEVVEMTDGDYKIARLAVEKGLSNDEITDHVELMEIRNSRSKVPSGKTVENGRTHMLQVAECRLMSGIRLNVKDDEVLLADEKFLEKRYSKKVVEDALSLGEIGFKEMVAVHANAAPEARGRQFTCYGESDTREAVQFLSEVNVKLMSTMPNSFQSVSQIAMMQHFELAPQCTPSMFRTGTNPDLRPVPRMRINAGERWPKLAPDGKLTRLSFGEEEIWQTWLETRGGIVIFKDDDIINDNMGVINDIIAMMVEMGDTEDWEFFRHFYNTPTTTGGFYDNENTLVGADAVLSYDNVQVAWDRMKMRTIKKGNNEQHRMRIGSKFWLVVGSGLEKEAWKLFADDSNCDDCESNSERAWWRGKIEVKVCDEMDNETIYGDQAGFPAWALITQNRNNSPYELTTLRGMRQPRVERIALPGDTLGMGMRFYKRSRVNPMEKYGIIRALPEGTLA